MTHDDNPELDTRLAQLRSALAGVDAPRCVEKELMQAFTSQFARQRPWYRRLGLLEWSATAACLLVTAAVFGLLMLPPHLAGESQLQPLVRIDSGAAFIALDSFERIEAEPDPRLVETEVPRTMLAALGLPVTPENAGEAVRAEMLVGAGGEPLALRLTSID
ncbi:hypothetical protein [Massilia litorea]|jgi:hypothetical protein|uniref:Uncharacterized protein n=1 Tax=Massilia litorea TaxID=2769491 RepID=A0A7L9U815_9BURK|nr:hypothetical protein [Massilia litorea]QOL50315.1 hypothetical protein LPB04_03110 [Massilia litorea]